MADCPELPRDLLDEIGKRLTYADHVRFCAVSMQWRSLITKRPKLPVSQIPWLVLPFNNDQGKGKDDYCSIYSLADRKVYDLELPEARGTLYRGSSTSGWLFMIEDGVTLKLVNPLMRKQIELPSIPALPDVIEYVADREDEEYLIQDEPSNYYLDRNHVHVCYVDKAVMSPTHTSRLNKEEYTMVVIYGEHSRLAFCKQGDTLWTAAPAYSLAENLERAGFYDALFHEGMFYAVTCGGHLFGSSIAMLPKVEEIQVKPPELSVMHNLYLVGTSSGLLMLERCYGGCSIDLPGHMKYPKYETTKFNIYELDMRTPPIRWNKVESLDHNKMFFVGNSSSLVATSRDFPELKGNCIYFTDDRRDFHRKGLAGGYDVGVFDLDYGTIKKLPGYNDGEPENLLVWPPPIWVMPTSC